MKVHDVVQGTEAWRFLRSGIPCASEFDRLMTPTGNPSGQSTQDKFLCDLLAERLMAHPRLEIMSKWMRRGKELEAEAASAYEIIHDVETVVIGFVTNDAETAGASPDRFVGDKGMLEIKCPSEGEHVSFLLQQGELYGKYKVQAQGQLYIAEREWTDLVSYHPEMPKAEIRIERDEKFISKLAEYLKAFTQRLNELYADCVANGWVRQPKEPPPPTWSDIMRESLISAQGGKS